MSLKKHSAGWKRQFCIIRIKANAQLKSFIDYKEQSTDEIVLILPSGQGPDSIRSRFPWRK